MSRDLQIGSHSLGRGKPTYFIADIGANHDGNLERAKALIHLAAESGADAAKFQNFTAETIVSDGGFRALGSQLSHQAGWASPVFEMYDAAAVDTAWTPALKVECDEAGIDYFTSPYSPELVDAVDPYVLVYKIGSGDITWLEIIEHIARKGKPVLLAAGASDLAEVERAVACVLSLNEQLLLMQCNTNYTGSAENFRYVNLNVLKTFESRFPELPLGLSDHTPGHAAVLGAVALGACAVEKHFTDDRTRPGPDHAFALTPTDWREMVDRTRELEAALGDGIKRVEENERETVVLQRRCVRIARDLQRGAVIARQDLKLLRPCPPDAIGAEAVDDIVGQKAVRDLKADESVTWADIG